MPPIDKRVEKSSKSVIALRDLLRRVCQSPGDYLNDEILRLALKSQGALAKYSHEELSIIPTSINTLKRVSAEYIDGGFEILDDLRKSALERLEDTEQKSKKSDKRTRAGLAQRVCELESGQTVLEKINYSLIQCLSDAVSDIRSIADIENMEVRQMRSREAIKKIVAIIAINPPPFDYIESNENVIDLKNKN